jgi:hypothetical protein
MAVEADVDEERKPSLQAQVQQAKARVLNIKVEVQTLAKLRLGSSILVW